MWPNSPVDCLVSLGSGSVPVTRREKSMSAYLDTGSVLIESACNVERIAALLYTLAPFVPNFKYFRSVLVRFGQYSEFPLQQQFVSQNTCPCNELS